MIQNNLRNYLRINLFFNRCFAIYKTCDYQPEAYRACGKPLYYVLIRLSNFQRLVKMFSCFAIVCYSKSVIEKYE